MRVRNLRDFPEVNMRALNEKGQLLAFAYRARILLHYVVFRANPVVVYRDDRIGVGALKSLQKAGYPEPAVHQTKVERPIVIYRKGVARE